MATRIALVRPDTGNAPFAAVPPLGLGYLANALRKRGHEVTIVDFGQPKFRSSRGFARLKDFRPGIVGIQVISRSLARANGLCSTLRGILPEGTPIVAGGPHPSTLPMHILSHLPSIDYAIAGEGEVSFSVLADRLTQNRTAVSDVPGLVWRTENGAAANPPVFERAIDRFDFPAWDMLFPELYPSMMGGFARRSPATIMLTSRGCPFRCTFCCAKFLGGGLYRCRSAGSIRDEMALLEQGYGIREIKFVDDCFNGSRHHVLALAEEIARRPVHTAVSVACGLNLNNLDGEVLGALKAIGVYEVPVAIESGSEAVLERMKKPIDLKDVHAKMLRIREHGFPVIAYFLLGFPGETRADIAKTVSFALKLPLSRVHMNCFSPLPGSPVHGELAREGRLPSVEERSLHFETFSYSFVEGVSVRKLNAIRKKALLRFYIRPKILPGFLWSLRRPATLRFIFRKAAEYFSA